jgi:hypothetical protein
MPSNDWDMPRSVCNNVASIQDEMIDYEALCSEILDPNSQFRRSSVGVAGSQRGRGEIRSPDMGDDVTTNARVLDRFRELKRIGVNILGEFTVHDHNNMGMVSLIHVFIDDYILFSLLMFANMTLMLLLSWT